MDTIKSIVKFSSSKLLIFFVLILISSPIYSQGLKVFNDSTTICKDVTTKYFKAYFNLDFDTMKGLMHDEISFQDPTAKFVFGGRKVQGKENVYENFKKAYASIIEMSQKTVRTMFSSNTGVFELNINWKYRSKDGKIISINMPLVIVLTVQNGKVIEHRDYGDYNYYVRQYLEQTKK